MPKPKKPIGVRVVCADGSTDAAIEYMNRMLIDLRLRQLGAKGESYTRCIELLDGRVPWARTEAEQAQLLAQIV